MENSTHLKYKDAIKLPKGGAVKMDKDNFTALAAEMISSKQGTRPEAIYNWANKHGVDLSKYGYILSDIKNNDELLDDVLNDKFDAVKTLVENADSAKKNKIKELKDMGISNAEELYEESLAKKEKEKVNPTLRKKLNKYINESINIKESNVKEVGIYDGDFSDELRKKYGEYPEGLMVDIDGDGMYYLKFNTNTGNFEVSATVYNNNVEKDKLYQFTKKEALKDWFEGKKYESGNRVDFIYETEINKALKNKTFQNDISKGLMTKDRAIEIIKSAGLEVPHDISGTKITRKDKREEISNQYGLTNTEVNEFFRISSVIKFDNKPTEIRDVPFANVLLSKGLVVKENGKYNLTEKGRLVSDEYFDINDNEKKEVVYSDLERVKEEYPIVLEWSEGLKETNIGFNYLYELANVIKQAGMSKTPNETVIKNKVWFKNYPHYVNIENGTDEKDGNYNTDLHGYESLNDWLKKYDPKFDWSIYDYGNNYKFGKEYTPTANFKEGDLVKFHTSNIDVESVDIDDVDIAYDNHYGYIVKADKYVRDSKRWKPYWSYIVKDKFDESIVYDNVMESRMTKVTDEKINKEITDIKIEEGSAELLTKEEAEKLSEQYIELLKGDYNQKNETLHNWFGEVISRYPKMLVEWQNIQLDYLPKKEQELLEYIYLGEVPNLKQFFNSLMKYNVGKKELIGLYELISERLVNDKLPKKVDFKLHPTDKGLSDIFKKIVSGDDLRPKLTGIYFDNYGVVGTDAQKLIFISGKHEMNGIFGIGKNSGSVIDDRYPDYKSVVPKEANNIISIDKLKVENIVNSLKTIKNSKYSSVADSVTISLYKGKGIQYSIVLLIELLEAWLKIGFDKLEFSYETEKKNKQVLFISPKIKEFTKFKGSGSILMAKMREKDVTEFIIPQTEMYIDVPSGKAETAGITDDLYSEFNLAFGTVGAIDEKSQIEELETLIELLKEVVAENPKDLDSKDALELYEETLVELKKVNAEKFEKGGRVGCGCKHSFAKGGEINPDSDPSRKNIQKNLLSLLENELGKNSVSWISENGIDATEDINKAAYLSIGFIKPIGAEDYEYVGKQIKLPKNKFVDVSYVMQQLNKDNVYNNFSDKFKLVLDKLGYSNNINVYPTTYGIGIFVFLGDKSQASKLVASILDKAGIEYKTEYSDASFVFRYKISKSKENIAKLEDFLKDNNFEKGGYIQSLSYSEILKRLKDEFGIDESDGKTIHSSDLMRIIQVDKNLDPNAGMNLAKVLTDNGWTIIRDKYEQGGLLESNGAKYFSKDFESKGNTWNILFVWGKFNYVSVSKKTNNPFRSGVGKEFKNVDEAISYYKNPDMKVQLIFAENEAKELGYVPIFENGGEVGEKELYYAVYDDNTLGLLFLDEKGNKRFLVLQGSTLRGSNYSHMSMPLYINEDELSKIRKATEKDFDIYRVSLPPDFNKLNSQENLKGMIKKGDIVLFKCEGSETECRGEILDTLSKGEYLVSKGIKAVIVPKEKVIGIAPTKINTIFEKDFSLYDERVMAINSILFHKTYGIGENPFEVNYDESNEYGYGIYFLDEKYSGVGKYKESRILSIKPNVKKPLIFLNDDGSSFNSNYKEAFDNSVKYDGVTSKDDFNKKMIEQGYDSMVISDIHGIHLILFYNDPKLYEIKSDKGN